jgi:hypothetical protein
MAMLRIQAMAAAILADLVPVLVMAAATMVAAVKVEAEAAPVTVMETLRIQAMAVAILVAVAPVRVMAEVITAEGMAEVITAEGMAEVEMGMAAAPTAVGMAVIMPIRWRTARRLLAPSGVRQEAGKE